MVREEWVLDRLRRYSQAKAHVPKIACPSMGQPGPPENPCQPVVNHIEEGNSFKPGQIRDRSFFMRYLDWWSLRGGRVCKKRLSSGGGGISKK